MNVLGEKNCLQPALQKNRRHKKSARRLEISESTVEFSKRRADFHEKPFGLHVG